jgi:parallel beta-helix repeat protein
MRTFLLLLAGCGSNAPTGPCAAVSGNCVSFATGSGETAIQTAFAAAKPKTTFIFGAGTFKFSNELSVSTDDATIQGAGMDMTTLDFTNQGAGAEGILGMNNGFIMKDITVQNTKGEGVKVLGATGVTFQRTHVTWTDPDNSTHGAYAIYPVQCTNVLVEDCVIDGAADAGVYVGQSEQIVVRRNVAHNNVAGIEIELSHFADVYNNEAHDNTAGILVFALPGTGLLVKDCHDVRLHDNMIHDNNTNNFAKAGSTVSIVPRGTGTFVLASDKVEVFNNTYVNNKTANFSVISYLASGTPANDPGYYQYPTNIYVHDNTFMGGGDDPDTSQGFMSIGHFLSVSLPNFPGMKDADIMYDGIIDQMRTGGMPNNPMNVCIGNNGAATFINLHFDQLDTTDGFVAASPDATNYTCTLPALAPVSFPGLT